MKIPVAKDSRSRAIFAHVVRRKGVDEEGYAVKRLAEDVEWLGYTRIILKSDGESAIVRLLKETLRVAKTVVVESVKRSDTNRDEARESLVTGTNTAAHTRDVPAPFQQHSADVARADSAVVMDQVVVEHPPPYDSRSNGSVENGVRLVKGHLRTMKSCLENKLRKKVPEQHYLMSWLV